MFKNNFFLKKKFLKQGFLNIFKKKKLIWKLKYVKKKILIYSSQKYHVLYKK